MLAFAVVLKVELLVSSAAANTAFGPLLPRSSLPCNNRCLRPRSDRQRHNQAPSAPEPSVCFWRISKRGLTATIGSQAEWQLSA